jgi:predicted RNA-binding Zn ribbon-like protein
VQIVHSEHPDAQGDWRGKFLFVGNQLALELLNTSLVQDGEPVELLATPADLADWLASAGLITAAKASTLATAWSTSEAAPESSASELSKLRAFREHLRSAVIDTGAGRSPSPAFVAELNRWLASYPTIHQAEIRADSLVATALFQPTTPRDTMRPLAAAALELLTHADRTRLRKCGGCVVHFLDVSKKGSRRWCSMNLCGNRRKVAAYQGRRRQQRTQTTQ